MVDKREQTEATALLRRVGITGDEGRKAVEGTVKKGFRAEFMEQLSDSVPGLDRFAAKNKRVIIVGVHDIYEVAGSISRPDGVLGTWPLDSGAIRVSGLAVTLPNGDISHFTQFQVDDLLRHVGSSFNGQLAQKLVQKYGDASERVVTFAQGVDDHQTKKASVDRALDGMWGDWKKFEHHKVLVVVTTSQVYLVLAGVDRGEVVDKLIGTFPRSGSLRRLDEVKVSFPDGNVVRLLNSASADRLINSLNP